MLCLEATTEKPVAICRTLSTSDREKAVAWHFGKSDIPAASLLCRDARVCIEGKNFNPYWGLYNGACGTVSEIVFKPGENPNQGHLPEYVVVDFPGYSGPIWDEQKPTVRNKTKYTIVIQANKLYLTRIYLSMFQYQQLQLHARSVTHAKGPTFL